MKNICIIPARGGSKRIPRKNVKLFCGKPIIEYSIESALRSGLFDEVMVSTDDVEISNLAINCGAKVPFLRSKITSNDFASTVDVLEEVLLNYKKKGLTFDNCCCLYATAPFITDKILNETFSFISKSKYSSVLPVIKYSHPIQRAFIDNDGYLEYKSPEYQNSRTQDLQPMYHDSGQFYWFNVTHFIKNKLIITDNTHGFEIPESKVRDIDTLEDWKIAEVLYNCINWD
ncbi:MULTISPECIES: pseudaminic acid cytidylyltransferase [unclassified Oceanispirochaeta]|uniref:pseudaminic acid cytidylyltransferase n=1 Tax=unclassified Oceanispirochaeta TaxID=2635722 RepID=UPI000E09C799|nr:MULTISPECIES: pseudaminic acid cytidylyltransferase [unclassified Oceanispirochaeta]MBF9018678.1 pseudaminic acid cytidylyltransferase [Oceanispirochaeta sp. M2]NPD75116.1 pseudaminic acid cytidylyltransferase [Oceanispirochaeta sp. M1]RDG29040.1 pseudaminic acid cytidylyltransferase [Oceanispirochaeta sp. M1]